MSFSRIYAIFLRQLFLLKGNPSRLANIFVWLLVDIIQWGFISKYLESLGQATFGFITVILGAIILWEFVTRIQQGIMTGFLEDIWSNNFINFFASPLKIGEYLIGLILNSIIYSLVGFMILIFIAGAFFGYNFFLAGLMLLPFLAILFVFGTAMGILVSAIIFRLGPSAEWLSWPIPMVLSVFAGVFYPVSTLPQVMQIISKAIPASYVFEGFRGIMSTTGFSTNLTLDMLLGGLLALLYLLAAYKIFISVYRQNLKTGAIARFNAEF